MRTSEYPSAERLGDGAADAIRAQFDDFVRLFFRTSDSDASDVSFQYRTGEMHPLGNAAVFRREASPADIRRALEPLARAAWPSAAVLMADDAPGQAEAVRACGYAPAERMPLMSVGPDGLAETALPAGYTLREVPVAEDAAWSEAVSVGYGLPLAVGGLFGVKRASELCAPGVARHFAVECAGEMVATSMLYLKDGLAGIYGVATRPEHRGKGLGAHLSAEPLRLAWSRGYRVGVLQASAMGAPVYRRIGYRTHGEMGLYVRVPGPA